MSPVFVLVLVRR